jgi:hypothetical protein
MMGTSSGSPERMMATGQGQSYDRTVTVNFAKFREQRILADYVVQDSRFTAAALPNQKDTVRFDDVVGGEPFTRISAEAQAVDEIV